MDRYLNLFHNLETNLTYLQVIYLISHMYKKLMMDMSDNTIHIKQRWELELNAIIDVTLGKTYVPDATRGLEANYRKNLTGRSKLGSSGHH